MKVKSSRLETLKVLISTKELSSQEEVLRELEKEGFKLTQATLSRDMKHLKVAKAATVSGSYVYVLPSESGYRRIYSAASMATQQSMQGFISVNFSGNMGVIKTRPGHASSVAYNIDNSYMPQILGTIAGDDTVFVVIKEGIPYQEVEDAVKSLLGA